MFTDISLFVMSLRLSDTSEPELIVDGHLGQKRKYVFI